MPEFKETTKYGPKSSIDRFNELVIKIIAIHDNAQYNKNICNSFKERVLFLNEHIQNSQQKERIINTYLFQRLVIIIENIKYFIRDMTQINGIKKYLQVASIKDKYNALIFEFDSLMNDLGIDNETIRKHDQQRLRDDLEKLRMNLSINDGNILYEIMCRDQIDPRISEFIEFIRSPIIEPRSLLCPSKKKTDTQKSVKRRLYNSLNVACSPMFIPIEENSLKVQSINQQIEMMNKLNSPYNILKFYGISHIDGDIVMVKEWAELGSLEDVYNNYNINWNLKIQIALDICRGICFMHENQILHKNLQCKSIMLTAYCEPKIANFEYASYMNKSPLSIPNIKTGRLLKKLKISIHINMTQDVNFGMLLWELAFEKIPYQDWNVLRIKNHVLNNNRESLRIESSMDDMLHEDYFTIIKNTWHQNPVDRSDFSTVFNKLEELVFSYYQNGISLNLDPKFSHFITSIDKSEEEAKKWIKDGIENDLLTSINWSEFNSPYEQIGKGNFGSIFKAYWTSLRSYVVCKKLTNLSDIRSKAWEAFRHEVDMQNRAQNCKNIIKVLGISKDFQDDYFIIMQYADEGDLRSYLSKNFDNLDWNKKFRLALDITNGLHYLHKRDILHRDLHAKNIVVHEGEAKITDFGYSKSIDTDTGIHEKLFGNCSYIAPEILRASDSDQAPYTKSSDIYSLGVLLWEISSGKLPFGDRISLILAVLSGKREDKVPGTPNEYYNLYSKCWEDKPEKRHTVEYVYDVLEKLLGNGDKKEEGKTRAASITSSKTLNDSLYLENPKYSPKNSPNHSSVAIGKEE